MMPPRTEPLPEPPVDGVPLAAIRHVTLAVPPISPGANLVFLLAAALAWSLEEPRTVAGLGALRSAGPEELAELAAGVDELVERDYAFIGDDGRVHLVTGVPGAPPPPPAAETWAAAEAWEGEAQ